MLEMCINQSCKKEFTISCIGAGIVGGAEREPIICPYCGHITREERTSGTFQSHKIIEPK